MNLDYLKKLAFFTNKDLKLHFNIKYPEIYLNRLNKKNKIIKIEKGKYTLYNDSLVYSTIIVSPSYLSFLSALNFYGYTTQLPLKNTVAIKFQKQDTKNITFVRINSKYFFGYKKIKYKGFDLFIATKEKLLIDCLVYQNQVSVSEIFDLLNDNLDKNKIINYLKKINNINLIKRIGFLLDLVNIDIYKDFSKKIKKNNVYVKLNKHLKKTKNNNSKWKININEVINNDRFR